MLWCSVPSMESTTAGYLIIALPRLSYATVYSFIHLFMLTCALRFDNGVLI